MFSINLFFAPYNHQRRKQRDTKIQKKVFFKLKVFNIRMEAAMGEFADGHTSSTKIQSSRVEYRVGKISKTIESSTRCSSTFELDFWGRVFRVKLGGK